MPRKTNHKPPHNPGRYPTLHSNRRQGQDRHNPPRKNRKWHPVIITMGLLIFIVAAAGLIINQFKKEQEPAAFIDIFTPFPTEIAASTSTQIIIPTLPSIPDIIEQATYNVVLIQAFDRLQRIRASQGSGVIINNDGYIVTNAHVIGTSEEVFITSPYMPTTVASVIGISMCDDLALLKIQENEEYSAIPVNLALVPRAGDEVIALGYPMNTIISSSYPSASTSRISRVGQRLNNIDGLIEHQATINPGNSGGPLLDRSGYLVGINTMTIEGTQGLFYAIGLERVELVTTRLINQSPATHLTKILISEPTTGSISNVGEKYCYQITLKQGQTIKIDVTGINLDPYIILWGIDNRFIADSDDISTINQNSQIIFTANQAGTYQLSIDASPYSTSDKRRGDYEITITQISNP